MKEVLAFYPILIDGTITTIILTVLSAILALGISFVVGLSRISKFKIVRVLAIIYLEFFRGSSALVQMFFIYFVLPMWGIYLGGPAIGIFETATFKSSSCDFNRDDMLLAFSDGLEDVRNPQDESLGVEEVIKLLQSKYSSQWSAQMLANDLEKAFNLHKKTAEQFDDLTILCMKAKRID